MIRKGNEVVTDLWKYALNGRLRKALKRVYKIRLAMQVQRMSGTYQELPFLVKQCFNCSVTVLDCPFKFRDTRPAGNFLQCFADECFNNKRIPTDDYKCNISPYWVRGYRIHKRTEAWKHRVKVK